MNIHLTFSLYWLLVPLVLVLVLFVAYKTRNLGGGPGDALYTMLIMGLAFFVLLLALIGLMAFNLLAR